MRLKTRAFASSETPPHQEFFMEKVCKCGETRQEKFTSSVNNKCAACVKADSSPEDKYCKEQKPHWDLLNAHWRPRIRRDK